LHNPIHSPRDALSFTRTKGTSFSLHNEVTSFLYYYSSQFSAKKHTTGFFELSIALQTSCNPLAKVSLKEAAFNTLLVDVNKSNSTAP